MERATLSGVFPVRLRAARRPGIERGTARTRIVGSRTGRLGAALIPLILLGCASETGPITIGAAGAYGEGFGLRNRQGIELAVEEINARGGIAGRELVVVFRDDRGDGATAATIAEEFLSTPEISAVVGHVSSGAMVAAARIYDDGLPAVSTTATAPALTGISPWVFRVISSDSTNAVDLARFADSRGFRRAVILYENDSYGRGLMDNFRRAFSGEIVSIDPLVAEPDDFEPYVAFYRMVEPDLVFVAGTERSGLGILAEARRQELPATFLGGDGWTGVTAERKLAEGVYVGMPFTPSDPRPEAQRFVRAYRDRFGIEPDGNAALAYDATMLVASAIAAVGTDRQAIRDYLAGLNENTAYNGVTGRIHFHETGDPVGKSFTMTRVQNGDLVVEEAP